MTQPDSANASPSGVTIGEQLVRSGRLTGLQVQQIVDRQNRQQMRFGEAAISLGLLTEAELQSILAEQYNYPVSGGTGILSHLAIASAPFSREAEAVRQIRAGISARLAGDGSPTLAIVSPGRNEGKSYMAASLAVAFSQAGKRTLLINGNLRESGQQGLLNARPAEHSGLSTILSGRAAAVPGVSVPHFPKLNLLDAGPPPPNPSELLLEPAFQALIRAFSSQFDLFIVDTPAYGLYSDAQIIARQVDACIAVARRDLTGVDELRDMYRHLEQTGARSFGIVYNEAPMTKTPRLRAAGRRARN